MSLTAFNNVSSNSIQDPVNKFGQECHGGNFVSPSRLTSIDNFSTNPSTFSLSSSSILSTTRDCTSCPLEDKCVPYPILQSHHYHYSDDEVTIHFHFVLHLMKGIFWDGANKYAALYEIFIFGTTRNLCQSLITITTLVKSIKQITSFTFSVCWNKISLFFKIRYILFS